MIPVRDTLSAREEINYEQSLALCTFFKEIEPKDIFFFELKVFRFLKLNEILTVASYYQNLSCFAIDNAKLHFHLSLSLSLQCSLLNGDLI